MTKQKDSNNTSSDREFHGLQAEHEHIRQDKKQRNLNQYVNIKNSDGRTALTIVTKRDFLKCVIRLIELTDVSNLSIESAIESKNPEILDKYLEKYKDSQQELGDSGIHQSDNVNQKSCLYLLHLACRYNNEVLLTYICERKEKPDQLSVKDNNGYTPILVAAKYGNDKCIKYLVEQHKLNLNIEKEKTENKKQNILHLCAENYKILQNELLPNAHIKICELIIKEYKSLSLDFDYNGNSPLHIA
ncbi:unnamed protein product, partial [Didymodactylos carnosus]